MNETDNVNVTKSDAISLAPSTAATTRASISDLSTLQDDPNGFVAYAKSGSNWYAGLDGSTKNNHVWDKHESQWGFETSVHWPGDANDYPMTFYAFYPQKDANNKVITGIIPPTSGLTLGVILPPDKKDQLDLLAGQKETKNKPASGTLTMTFNHILSKVNFSVSIDDKNYTAYVLALGFKNLYSQNNYDVIAAAWKPFGINTNSDSYEYYNSFAVKDPTEASYTENVFSSSSRNFFFDINDKESDEHLMLLPQDGKVWPTNVATVELPKSDEAFVQMLYRLENGTNVDFIGFKDASTHGGYATSQLKKDKYEGSLYVKVGYSFVLDWKQGKGYLYNIPLPGTGGRLLDDHLYDDKGNRTDLKVPGGKVPETILGSDDEIRLDPTVSDWDDQTIVDIIDK